ncbi:MAG TPA: antibiotic biosynthesis monooxygenase [Acidimicrobiales bacterium]|nr:antibiotic biosynthesis monooxygenase [Acidimicrobiales bacterium]
MVELLTQPPPMAAIARMTAIEGVRVSPTVLATQDGPEHHLGPEAAGAILVLQATFVDEDRATEFWMTAAGLMEELADAPGFIRRLNFTDGPHYTLIAFWRTVADAHAFFGRDAHQAAMRELYRGRWQYSHFAALWEITTPRQRVIFCQQCDGVTPATDGTCNGCGTELFDPYASAAPVDR